MVLHKAPGNYLSFSMINCITFSTDVSESGARIETACSMNTKFIILYCSILLDCVPIISFSLHRPCATSCHTAFSEQFVFIHSPRKVIDWVQLRLYGKCPTMGSILNHFTSSKPLASIFILMTFFCLCVRTSLGFSTEMVVCFYSMCATWLAHPNII
jgi:hypothetical protein